MLESRSSFVPSYRLNDGFLRFERFGCGFVKLLNARGGPCLGHDTCMSSPSQAQAKERSKIRRPAGLPGASRNRKSLDAAFALFSRPRLQRLNPSPKRKSAGGKRGTSTAAPSFRNVLHSRTPSALTYGPQEASVQCSNRNCWILMIKSTAAQWLSIPKNHTPSHPPRLRDQHNTAQSVAR